MKISIITVCYNGAKTIEETIKSVQMQSYDDIEYIVVDGNSTDATLEIISKYTDVVDILVSEKDKGLYDAMNKGIALANGDYIGILNSDDTFFEVETIKKVVEFLTNNDLDACVGDIVQHKNRTVIRRYSSKKWNPEKLKRGFMPPHPSIFFKKHLFRQFGDYKLGYKIAADYELIIRFFLKNNITYKYSNIITTSMAVGGESSSGLSSYKKITEEVAKAFNDNEIEYSVAKVKFRFLWKIFDLIKR